MSQTWVEWDPWDLWLRFGLARGLGEAQFLADDRFAEALGLGGSVHDRERDLDPVAVTEIDRDEGRQPSPSLRPDGPDSRRSIRGHAGQGTDRTCRHLAGMRGIMAA